MKSNNHRPIIVGTGLIALDLVISAEIGVPIRDSAGGTCGNVLSILSSLDWGSYPVARLNGDAASHRVAQDMERWGVRLDFARQMPVTDTPIVMQKIRKTSGGESSHSFSWKCPTCKSWFPPYKAVTGASSSDLAHALPTPDVFFFDRVSRGALTLASNAADKGAIVFFEPSAKGTTKQMKEAIEIAHIIKCSDQRFPEFPVSDTALLQIHTFGSKGLRYKSTLTKAGTKEWVTIQAVPVVDVTDTAGCGDWLTAGLLSKVGVGGLTSFSKISSKKLMSAMHFAQALSAWNCKFEGPRGGMYSDRPIEISYAVGSRHKREQIRTTVANVQDTDRHIVGISCPTCH